MNEEIKKERKNVFTNKNFTLVFLGALVSNVASLFYSFAVSFYILKITDNNALIQGLYLAVGGLVFCVVSLFGGVISDRFNKAKIMYICDYLKGIIIIAFTLLLMFAIKSVTAKIVALFVVTVFSNGIAGIFSPASSALTPLIVEEDSLQQAQSYFSILNSFQSIVGIILAGVLYTLIPINTLFLIVGVCYILSGISEMFIKYSSEFERCDEKLTLKVAFHDIKDGFHYLSTVKTLLILLICSLFLNFFITPVFENFGPYFIASDVANSNYLFNDKMAPEMWSSFFSVAFGIGSLIMGIILSSIEQKEHYNKTIRYSLLAMVFTMITSAVFYILFRSSIIGINTLLIINIIIYTLIGIWIVLINVPSSTVMLRIVDKDKLGKVSSVISIGSMGLTPVALLLGGLAITYLGASGLLIVCTSGLLLIALIAFFSLRNSDL